MYRGNGGGGGACVQGEWGRGRGMCTGGMGEGAGHVYRGNGGGGGACVQGEWGRGRGMCTGGMGEGAGHVYVAFDIRSAMDKKPVLPLTCHLYS